MQKCFPIYIIMFELVYDLLKLRTTVFLLP